MSNDEVRRLREHVEAVECWRLARRQEVVSRVLPYVERLHETRERDVQKATGHESFTLIEHPADSRLRGRLARQRYFGSSV